jgi:hypothetical protein
MHAPARFDVTLHMLPEVTGKISSVETMNASLRPATDRPVERR